MSSRALRRRSVSHGKPYQSGELNALAVSAVVCQRGAFTGVIDKETANRRLAEFYLDVQRRNGARGLAHVFYTLAELTAHSMAQWAATPGLDPDQWLQTIALANALDSAGDQ